MAKKKIAEIAEGLLKDFLRDNGYELYHIEFIKEAKEQFLRVYIDWEPDLEDRYIGTADCEKVSRFLSEKLDELDPIESNYYLEVSSPGLDRALLTDKHYMRYSGKEVDVSLYKAVGDRKKFSGTLKGIEDDKIVIIDEKGNEIKFPKEQVARAKLRVNF